MINMNTLKSFSFFICLLLLSRLIPHPPNFTPLLAGLVFLPFILQEKKLIFIIPISVLLISDLIIGFHSHMLWTYGAFLFIGLIVLSFFKESITRLSILSVTAPTLFFLISNFGVWFGSSFYTKDFLGLIECYTLALPFYANNLISTIVFALAFYALRNFFQGTKKFA